MVRKVLKWAVVVVAGLLVAGAALFAFGLRVVLYGGGTPRLQFVESERTRSERLARSREAQRVADVDVRSIAAPIVATPAQSLPAQSLPAQPSPLQSLPAPPTAADSRIPGDAPSRGANWTDFRGPRRDGHYREGPILTSWPADGLKPIWKQPVGGGYASFVSAGGRAFTIEQRGPQEVVAAYDVATGRELWATGWPTVFRESMGGDGPRATPSWADGRIYALGAAGELRSLDDATGRTLWRTNILEDAGAANLQWGMSAAPLIVDGTVIVLPGGRNGQAVVAYDATTGKRAWASLEDRVAYASPMLVTMGGVRQIVIFTATRLAGITLDRGDVLWEYPWKTNYDVNAAQPLLVSDSRLFISSGYGTGASVVEVTRSGDRFTATEVWRNIRMKNQFTSSVLHEGFIYGLDESILACLDAATGAVKWKGGRYGYGQVMLASGHLIVLTEEGELILVRATPDSHQEIARSSALAGKTWNHPAMTGGYLLVRNINEMAAFDLRLPTR